MAKTFTCSDAGYFPDCNWVTRRDTDEEVMREAAEHGRSVHGMSEEQLADPETQRIVRRFIREG